MFILIYGKDSYRAWQKFKELVEDFQQRTKVNLSLDFLDLQETTFHDFKNQLQHNSIFGKEKIVVQRNVLSNAGFQESFLKEAKHFSDDKSMMVVFYEEKDSFSSDDLLVFFKEHGQIYKFDCLSPALTTDWAKKEVIKLGAKIDSSALPLLVKRTGSDLWRLSAEIRKLIAYKGKSRIIEKKDVELLVKPQVETAIFKMIDAIAAKNKKTALTLLYNHLEKGDPPLYLLSMIIFQFRNLLLVKDLEPKPLTEMIALLKPMHPFVVRKSSWLAKKFTMQELEKIYIKLFRMDLAVKTGKIKPELALELLIADI